MLVFCISGVMTSSDLEVFSNSIMVVSVPRLSYLVQTVAAPFQILRCLSDSTQPKWHKSTQEMAT